MRPWLRPARWWARSAGWLVGQEPIIILNLTDTRHQITARYSPQSLRKLQWLAPRKISQIGRYVRGNGPLREADHLPHELSQRESSRPRIPQWESRAVAAVAEPGGLGGCVGLRRDQGNIG